MDERPIETSSDAETAHKIGHKTSRSARIEVITGKERHRSWTLEQKREIVAESLGSYVDGPCRAIAAACFRFCCLDLIISSALGRGHHCASTA